MRSHVYLESMTPDGKPGAVKEIVYEDAGPQQYAEPVSYAENDALGKLRHDVHVTAAKLRHAKGRGQGVAQAQKAHDDAKSAAGKAHFEMQKAREQQKTGSDYGAVDPFSRQSDTRQFMPVRDYSLNDTDTDSSGRTFDDEADDELEVAIRKAVDDLEKAQAAGGDPATMKKLEAALKVLRDQLPNPSAPPNETSVAPPKMNRDRKDGGDTGSIEAPFPGAKPISSGPGSRQSAAPAVKKNDRAARKARNVAALDALMGRRRKVPSAHSETICCQGQFLCPRCKATAAAV